MCCVSNICLFRFLFQLRRRRMHRFLFQALFCSRCQMHKSGMVVRR